MNSQLPVPGAGRKPFPPLRRPSSISKPATPPPTRTIYPTTYRPGEILYLDLLFTIAARALSFQGQVLNGVTPLQLAQNGFHYKPYPRFGGLACCFACQSFKRLDSFQSAPFRETQQLHVDNCIWEVIYSEIKQHLEPTTSLDISTNASPLARHPLATNPFDLPDNNVSSLGLLASCPVLLDTTRGNNKDRNVQAPYQKIPGRAKETKSGQT
jgi:hypothetical protein